MRAREEKLTTTAHKYVEVIIKILMLISKILMVRKKNSDGQNFSNQHQNSFGEHHLVFLSRFKQKHADYCIKKTPYTSYTYDT